MIDSSSSTFNSINKESDYYKKKNKIITFLSNKKNLIENKQKISVVNLSKIIQENKIDKIDVLKIDTEGFEYNILRGIKEIDYEKNKIYIFRTSL